ncbi:hypothetical protein [Simplicispira psychrophila]|uniref:hypothetical protein n=1 Tax=Simplicispira psychrophila TaxID=80882 RepID=UPI0012EC76FB|nr:hypothetical protein [Simplicispira psychrophila]
MDEKSNEKAMKKHGTVHDRSVQESKPPPLAAMPVHGTRALAAEQVHEQLPMAVAAAHLRGQVGSAHGDF